MNTTSASIKQRAQFEERLTSCLLLATTITGHHFYSDFVSLPVWFTQSFGVNDLRTESTSRLAALTAERLSSLMSATSGELTKPGREVYNLIGNRIHEVIFSGVSPISSVLSAGQVHFGTTREMWKTLGTMWPDIFKELAVSGR